MFHPFLNPMVKQKKTVPIPSVQRRFRWDAKAVGFVFIEGRKKLSNGTKPQELDEAAGERSLVCWPFVVSVWGIEENTSPADFGCNIWPLKSDCKKLWHFKATMLLVDCSIEAASGKNRCQKPQRDLNDILNGFWWYKFLLGGATSGNKTLCIVLLLLLPLLLPLHLRTGCKCSTVN